MRPMQIENYNINYFFKDLAFLRLVLTGWNKCQHVDIEVTPQQRLRIHGNLEVLLMKAGYDWSRFICTSHHSGYPQLYSYLSDMGVQWC